jgi:uncharacterized protein
VGLVGIVLPVIPGSPVIALAVLVWAIDAEAGAAWAVLAVVLVLLAAGWSTTYLVTGRRVHGAGVPTSSIVVAGLAGIVGFFVLPVAGLFLFFPLALFGMEYRRLRSAKAARASAWVAIRATALGMIIELALASTAAATWLVAVLVGVGR